MVNSHLTVTSRWPTMLNRSFGCAQKKTKAVEAFKSQWKGTGLAPGLMSWLRRVSLRLLNLDCRYPRDLLQPARKKKRGQSTRASDAQMVSQWSYQEKKINYVFLSPQQALLEKRGSHPLFPLKGWALPLWGEAACAFCIPEGLPATWLDLCFTTLLSLMEQKDKRSTQAKESTPCSAESSSSMQRQKGLQDWQTCVSAWSQILPNHTRTLPSLRFRISMMKLACFHHQQNMERPAALLKGSSTPTMI